MYIIENIVGHKRVGGVLMLEVKWAKWDDTYNTWESAHELSNNARNLIVGAYMTRHGLRIEEPSVRKAAREKEEELRLEAQLRAGREPHAAAGEASVDSNDDDDDGRAAVAQQPDAARGRGRGRGRPRGRARGASPARGRGRGRGRGS
jgi:hypothetical protein